LFRTFIRATLLSTVLSGGAFAQSPLEHAVTLAREKRYSESSQILRSVPEPTETGQRIAFHRLKAANASGLGDKAAAVSEMLHGLELAPSDPSLLVGTAMVEFQAGQLDDALHHAEKAGNNPTAKAVIGDIQERRGNFEEATNAYREAVTLAPGHEEYRVTLAYDLIQHQNFRSAIELLEQSAPLFPGSARIRTLLGIVQYSNGYLDEAIASLVEAIAADPKMESAYRCLSQIVLQSSAAPRPAVVEHLCRWNATVCSALKLRVARNTNDSAMQNVAIAGLRRAPANDPVARCELARAWEWTNRLQEARTEMEACLRFDASPQNHYRMGLIYKRLGLNDLSQNEMDQRKRMLQEMSEETALGLDALKAFR
jgi:tetratricopeptide (TPR) repeat protein